MSHRRNRVTPETAKVSFIEISPSKRRRKRVCSLENSDIIHPVALIHDNTECDEDVNDGTESETVTVADETPLPRSYLQRQQRVNETWAEIREQLHVACVESSVPDIGCMCTICNVPATIMCKQCGAQAFFALSVQNLNICYTTFCPQVWQVCMYTLLTL